MENRYSVHPEQVKRFTTEELRSHFLMDSLFTENKLTMYYSHEDRVVIGGAAPGQSELKLDAGDFLKTDFFWNGVKSALLMSASLALSGLAMMNMCFKQRIFSILEWAIRMYRFQA